MSHCSDNFKNYCQDILLIKDIIYGQLHNIYALGLFWLDIHIFCSDYQCCHGNYSVCVVRLLGST
jgi:hypothetical protein